MAYTAGEIGELITATAALGTASYGLVDVSKAFGGGISNVGYSRVKRGLTPFAAQLDAVGAWGAIAANWLNGMDKTEQKKKVKESIKLGLAQDSAAEFVKAAGAADFATLAAALASEAPTADQTALRAKFDVFVDSRLDAAFEGGEQLYKSVARAAAFGVAVILAEAGAYFSTDANAFDTTVAIKAFLVGIVATPVAPIAKDLSSALATAVTAFKAAKA